MSANINWPITVEMTVYLKKEKITFPINTWVNICKKFYILYNNVSFSIQIIPAVDKEGVDINFNWGTLYLNVQVLLLPGWCKNWFLSSNLYIKKTFFLKALSKFIILYI